MVQYASCKRSPLRSDIEYLLDKAKTDIEYLLDKAKKLRFSSSEESSSSSEESIQDSIEILKGSGYRSSSSHDMSPWTSIPAMGSSIRRSSISSEDMCEYDSNETSSIKSEDVCEYDSVPEES